MKLLVAIAPERYRDEELTEPLSVFREQGTGFDIASTRPGSCSGMLGGETRATLGFQQIDPTGYAGLVIVGGAGSKLHLWEDRDLARLATAFFTLNKTVAAICLSPVIFARAGILKERKATVFPSPDAIAEMKKGGAILTGQPVVTDGTIVTADGPEAARAFGSAIVSALTR